MSQESRKDYITDAKLMVLYVLLKYSDEDHPLKKDEILAKVNAEYLYRGSIPKSTLDRNLTAVRAFLEEKGDLFGEFQCGTKTNKDRMVNVRIAHLFSNYELRYLIDMVSSCDYIKIKERQQLIKKLLSLSSVCLLSEYRPYLYKNPVKAKIMQTDFFKNLKAIHQALKECHQIQFYRVQRDPDGAPMYETDENGNDRLYTVNPYRTVFSDGFCYLVCSRVPEDGSKPARISNYRIDRMSDIQILSDKGIFPETSIAGAPKNIDTKKYISTHRMMWSGTPEKVRFRCPQWAMNEVVDYFGDTYKICSAEQAADGSEPMLTVEVENTWNNMLIWARRFFDFVEILSPDSLRQKLKDDITKAYEKYSKDV